MERFTVDLNLSAHKSFHFSVRKYLPVLSLDPYSTNVFFYRKRSIGKKSALRSKIHPKS
ncbi:hypothetical protein LEP1GSC005_0533 [Leptospira santarosai str. ST188]|nr:hypothetical protein LEP1GSC163_1569 [Leptospira santarosai str. CBC379]EKS09375.1 hypothetical protein LEP1GSC071_3723 [Leptospira santarosai str. JET]EMF90458.1 hypothetical protein LEP1GSC005_0533 [Leptospira santarosai str. ST188]EMO23222.1 hypothetical protein LEP1GSC168_0902 [Leptospira santarosai str. HAI134]EMO33375.1 hypothetical protein LEP1GSC175_3536 [Leptospira santarosai str. HAI821]EMO69649.1 hypothetical protein LEP1GSC130_0090 [Leptospira santarosai str. 200403458]EMP00067